MKTLLLITHTAVFLLGWIFVSLANPDPPAKKFSTQISSTGKDTARRKTTKPQRAKPVTTLETLAHTPMESRQRKAYKKELIEKWAAHDPLGLLEHMTNRKWPQDHWSDFSPGDAFNQLAKTHPHELLRYGRENGCPKALITLARRGNPHLVLQLFLEQKEHPIPAHYYRELFESGCGKDPDFHHLVHSAPDRESLSLAFIGSGKALLAIERHEEYFRFFEKHQGAIDVGQAIVEFSSSIVKKSDGMSMISSLPVQYHERAIKELLEKSIHHNITDNDHRMNMLDTMIKKDWIRSHGQAATEIIKIDTNTWWSNPSYDLQIARKWHQWALTVPDQPHLADIQRTAIRRWILRAPSDWEKIAQLPSQKLRDVAYTAAVDSSMDHERSQWMVSQIHDTHYREAAEKTLQNKMNESDDPFANTAVDPYDPLATQKEHESPE
ncbi:MAG: hypothetical protein AB8F34_13590 [Akkermansiaceae bacterium]